MENYVYPILTDYDFDGVRCISIDFNIVAVVLHLPINSSNKEILEKLCNIYNNYPEVHNLYTLKDLLLRQFPNLPDVELEYYRLKYS